MTFTRHPSFVSIACLSLVLASGSASAAPPLNRIQQENRQPGTTAWQLTNPAAQREIEGYPSLTSVPVGGNISFFVNTKDPTYTMSIFRMGWYGGTGGRKVQGPQVIAGVQQVTPNVDPTKDVIECHWTNPVTVHVPSSWMSGVYLAKLHGNTSGKEAYIIFVVRDSRRADLVYELSVITYQAYNPWPGFDTTTGNYNGQSLYRFETVGFAQVKKISFDRPYGLAERGFGTPTSLYSRSVNGFYGIGAGDFLHNIASAAMDFGFVRWLEHQGYDVTYITDVDTHEDVGRLLRAKGYLSGGHDEYVTREMKAHIVQARDQGVGLGFFGANYVYWGVALLPSSSGKPNRTISLFTQCKDNTTGICSSEAECSGNSDCAAGEHCALKECKYADTLDANGQSETEQLIAGGMWDPGAAISGGGDIVVNADAQLDSWVLANTGLEVGDVIPGIVGPEYNAVIVPEQPIPDGLQIVLRTQVPNFGEGNPGFPLPADFDGKDFDSWYDDAIATGLLPKVCSNDSSTLCTDQKHCSDAPGTACTDETVATDCGPPPATCVSECDPGTCINPCLKDPISPLGIVPIDGFCSDPFPYWPFRRFDWAMTVYQAASGAWVFNAATNEWSWGLDDYFTGLETPDGANNGPALRIHCGYPWFHPDLVSCRNPAIEQITRNVLDRFIGHG